MDTYIIPYNYIVEYNIIEEFNEKHLNLLYIDREQIADMKRLLLTTIMGLSFFGLFGQTNKFKTVDVNEFEKFITDTNVTLLDVRTEAEHSEGFIPGTHFNIDVLEGTYTKVATETLPKDKPVALYCRSGNRSKNAARILAENGYEVVELGTGFRGWVAAGKKIKVEGNKVR